MDNITEECERLDLVCINTQLKIESESSIIKIASITLMAFAWFLYLAYYNSRAIGILISKTFLSWWSGKGRRFKEAALFDDVSVNRVALSLLDFVTSQNSWQIANCQIA